MPRSRMACGVFATGNSLRVALFTPTSVACADSSTAASSSKGVLYSSSVSGSGLAACRVAKKGSIAAFFHRGRQCMHVVAARTELATMAALPSFAAGSHAIRHPPRQRRNLRHPRTLQAAGQARHHQLRGWLPGQRDVRCRGAEGGECQALAEEPGGALQYGATEGYEPLRAQLSAFMKGKGVEVAPDGLIVTTGSSRRWTCWARPSSRPATR